MTAMKTDGTKRYAAVLSLTEMGLGSLLHSLHVPLAGHALSLNQGAILTFALKRAENRRKAVEGSAAISLAAAGMKALSPAGKRLTPMLGISVQGFLYALGTALGGRNLAGAVLGMALLSVWAFAQPVLLAWIIFGKELFYSVFDLWQGLAEKIGLPVETGIWVLAAVVALKVLAGVGVGALSWLAAPAREESYITGLSERVTREFHRMRGPVEAESGLAVLALRDMVRPWFVASFGISLACFFAFRDSNLEAAVVYGFRVLLTGWLAFWFFRWAAKRWQLWEKWNEN